MLSLPASMGRNFLPVKYLLESCQMVQWEAGSIKCQYRMNPSALLVDKCGQPAAEGSGGEEADTGDL